MALDLLSLQFILSSEADSLSNFAGGGALEITGGVPFLTWLAAHGVAILSSPQWFALVALLCGTSFLLSVACHSRQRGVLTFPGGRALYMRGFRQRASLWFGVFMMALMASGLVWLACFLVLISSEPGGAQQEVLPLGYEVVSADVKKN